MKKLIFALALALILHSLPLQLVAATDDSTPATTRPIPVALKAFHPGHTVDGVRDTGEFIELVSLAPNTFISLAGLSIDYINKNGNKSNVMRFPEGSGMTGEHVLLRLARSPEASEADLTYTTNLAAESGALELVFQDVAIDYVCWGSIGETCLASFSKTPLSSIVQNTTTNTFAHQNDYTPSFNSLSPSYVPPPTTEGAGGGDESIASQCKGLQFSELLAYYEDDKSEQFIELYNSTEEPIILSGCALRYKKKLYQLSGTAPPLSYVTRDTSDFTLTKNPTTSNTIELLDTTSEVLDTLTYYHGQEKTASYALFGYQADGSGNWQITYHPTPGEENIFQEYRTCPAGKVINEATGNCVKASTLTATVTDCPAGKYRNPDTGRCKKYEETSISACQEGYERNPETNRCRKIKTNTGADFSLLPQTATERSHFVAAGAIGALILAGLSYIAYQFRHEVKKFLRRFPPLYRAAAAVYHFFVRLRAKLAQLWSKRKMHPLQSKSSQPKSKGHKHVPRRR